MNFTILTTTLNVFITAFSAGFVRLLPAIRYLLYTLAGIELILFALWWALGGGEQLVSVFKKILALTFWLWLVSNFPMLSTAFRDSLIDAGLIAGGAPGNHTLLLNPSRIAGYGVTITSPLAHELANLDTWEVGSAIVYGLSYLLIMACYIILAIQVFLAVLEFYLLAAVVGILLPFGVFGPTRFLSEKAIGAIIAAGVKLMILAFVLAITDNTMATAIHFTHSPIPLDEIMAVLLISGAIMFLALKAPSLAAGLLAGSPSLDFGHAAHAARAGASNLVAGAQHVKAATAAAVTGGAAAVLGGARMIGATASGAQRGASTAAAGGASSSLVIAGGAAYGAATGLIRSTLGSAGRGVSSMAGAVAGQFRAGAASASGRSRANSWNADHETPNWWDNGSQVPPPSSAPAAAEDKPQASPPSNAAAAGAIAAAEDKAQAPPPSNAPVAGDKAQASPPENAPTAAGGKAQAPPPSNAPVAGMPQAPPPVASNRSQVSLSNAPVAGMPQAPPPVASNRSQVSLSSAPVAGMPQAPPPVASNRSQVSLSNAPVAGMPQAPPPAPRNKPT